MTKARGCIAGGNNSLSTYVELKAGVDPASVNKQLYNFIQKEGAYFYCTPVFMEHE